MSDGACEQILYITDSLYIRGMNLCRLTPALATLPEDSFPDPKIALHLLYRSLLVPLAPQFFRFFALPHPFLKIFSPRLPAYVRRALNRRAAPSPRVKTPEFRGKPPHPHLASALKSPAKHPSIAPKAPLLTPLHTKKLSKVRSTLLTAPPGECILEYMRLKEAAQTTPYGVSRAAPTASTIFKLTRLVLEEAGR